MGRLRIGILSAADTRTRAVWSGTPYFMARALERQAGTVEHLGPVAVPLAAPVRALSAAARLGRRRYDYDHSVLVSRLIGRELRRRGRPDVDVLFAPAASTAVASFQTDIPIVSASDTTFRLLAGHYPEFARLLGISRLEGDRVERLALRRSTALTYPTEWAARSAVADYGIPRERIDVTPYGANLDEPPPPDVVAARLPPTPSDCRLLFIGVSWQRKGGQTALDALDALERLGIAATLTVCGCEPPAGVRHPRLRVVPFLDKADPAQRVEFDRLMREAHLLLFPTRSECFGMVICEANAYGLPALTRDTGGLGEVVRSGENGLLLPPEAAGAAYADAIAELVADPDRYLRLCATSRAAYDARLNWDGWARRITVLLEAAACGRIPARDETSRVEAGR